MIFSFFGFRQISSLFLVIKEYRILLFHDECVPPKRPFIRLKMRPPPFRLLCPFLEDGDEEEEEEKFLLRFGDRELIPKESRFSRRREFFKINHEKARSKDKIIKNTAEGEAVYSRRRKKIRSSLTFHQRNSLFVLVVVPSPLVRPLIRRADDDLFSLSLFPSFCYFISCLLIRPFIFGHYILICCASVVLRYG